MLGFVMQRDDRHLLRKELYVFQWDISAVIADSHDRTTRRSAYAATASRFPIVQFAAKTQQHREQLEACTAASTLWRQTLCLKPALKIPPDSRFSCIVGLSSERDENDAGQSLYEPISVWG
jgi:hypothetical protein